MTDPQNPDNTPPPPAYAQTPPPASQPTYSSAPPAQYGAPANAPIPGKTLGIVALVVAIFFNVIGLILGIVALVQSRKAGYKNGWAVAAIIVGAVLTVLGIIITFLIVGGLLAAGGLANDAVQACEAAGYTGTVTVQGVEVDCATLR
jgi:hypothetical protein